MTSPTSLPAPPLAPAGPRTQQRGIQVPQLLLSLLVVAVFALLAVWWQASSTSRTGIVGLAVDVAQGESIAAADLTEIFISTDVPTNVVPIENRDVFVGARPVADLSAGTLLTTEMFVTGAELEDGQAFVGLVLDFTRAPRGIVAGDRVQVLVAGDDGVDIISPDARVDSANYDTDSVTLRLRLALTDGQRVQASSGAVVVIEVENSGLAPWESEAPS